MVSSNLDRALAAFNANRHDEARQILKTHLANRQGDTEALYLLGIIEQASYHLDVSALHYDQVLALKPGHLGAHYNKALLLSSLGKHNEAVRHLDAAAKIAPENYWVYINRGNSLAALSQHESALVDFDRALALSPNLAAAWANKGSLLLDMGAYAQALSCLDQSVRLDPNSASNWANRACALVKLHRPDEALGDAERCLAIDSAHAGGWNCKAIALRQVGRLEDALTCIERAIQTLPNDGNIWLTRGDILTDLDRYPEGFSSYDRSLELNPEHAPTLVNKGVVLADLGHQAEARRCFEQACQTAPGNPDARWNLAVLDIQQGHMEDGWPRFEARWHKSESSNRPLTTQQPVWCGTPSGQPLLLWGEQGIGDQILYGSVLPELSTLPQRKYVALDRRLLPLFARSMPAFEFVDLAQTDDTLGFSEQLPLGSLPGYFRRSRESFAAAQHPFLKADPERTAILRAKIEQGNKLVCGVSWSSKRVGIGPHKSIRLDQMLPPLASSHLHFVDLQYGDTTVERQALHSQYGIDVQHLDEIDNFADIDGLAALITACDVVVTTSNTTAHLAGALGKQTLLLLPFGKGKLWYWTVYDRHSLWYPSILAFSQEQPGDWSRPLAAIATRLVSEI